MLCSAFAINCVLTVKWLKMVDIINSNGHFGIFDYVIFIGMLVVSMGIGIYFGYFDGKEKTTKEYLLGGKNMKVIPIAISLVAR